MVDRYVKDEGGKKIVYENTSDGLLGFLSPDHRVGEIKETSIIDIGKSHRHEFVPDSVFGIREAVNEKGTSLYSNDSVPPLLRPNDYEITDQEGDTTTYGYDSWSDRHIPVRNESIESSQPKNPSRSSARTSSGSRYTAHARSGSSRTATQNDQRKVPTSQKMKVEDKTQRDGPSGLVVFAVVVGGILLFNAVFGGSSLDPFRNRPTPQRTEYNRVPLPPISLGTMFFGFISLLCIFVGSFVFGHAISTAHDNLVFNLLEIIVGVFLVLPSKDWLLNAKESRRNEVRIHAEYEDKLEREWEELQDKRFGQKCG